MIKDYASTDPIRSYENLLINEELPQSGEVCFAKVFWTVRVTVDTATSPVSSLTCPSGAVEFEGECG